MRMIWAQVEDRAGLPSLKQALLPNTHKFTWDTTAWLPVARPHKYRQSLTHVFNAGLFYGGGSLSWQCQAQQLLLLLARLLARLL